MSAGNVIYNFAVKNTGDEPIVIRKIYTSCMCTTAAFSVGGKSFGPFGMPGHGIIPQINAAIEPGADSEVRVVFDPAAHGPAGIGMVEREVYLENSVGEPLRLKIRATVTP